MEKFIVSARKYRPTTFDTVVGQRSITGTLKNAIKTLIQWTEYLFVAPVVFATLIRQPGWAAKARCALGVGVGCTTTSVDG